jgi:hypothetical protein
MVLPFGGGHRLRLTYQPISKLLVLRRTKDLYPLRVLHLTLDLYLLTETHC